MAEYTIEGPEGQSFTISGPDNEMLDPSERAARRTRESVQPEGGRQEGEATYYGVTVPGSIGAFSALDIGKKLLVDPLVAGSESMRGIYGSGPSFDEGEAPESNYVSPERMAETHRQGALAAEAGMAGIARLPRGGGVGELGSGGGRPPVRRGAPPPNPNVAPDEMRAYYDEALRVGRITPQEHQGFMDAVQQIENSRSPRGATPPAGETPDPLGSGWGEHFRRVKNDAAVERQQGRFTLTETPSGWEIHDQHGLIVGGLTEQDAMNRMARINGDLPPSPLIGSGPFTQVDRNSIVEELENSPVFDPGYPWDGLTAAVRMHYGMRGTPEERYEFTQAVARELAARYPDARGSSTATAPASAASFQGLPPSTQPAAPQIISPQRGFLGGDREATDAFRQYIAPHANEQEFAEKYFGGLYSNFISFSYINPRNYGGIGGPQMQFSGPLMQNGRNIGRITRRIYPESGVAENAYLSLNSNQQGNGIAKRLLSGQVDIYEAMGLDRVEVSTGLDRGGYAWARYGFLPSEAEWHEVRVEAVRRLTPVLGELNSAQRVLLRSTLQMNDPHAIWDLAQFAWPVGANQVPLGKYLLSGNDWHGTLNLKDPVTMEKFNDYVGRKKQP
jgi:hypothetical protein